MSLVAVILVGGYAASRTSNRSMVETSEWPGSSERVTTAGSTATTTSTALITSTPLPGSEPPVIAETAAPAPTSIPPTGSVSSCDDLHRLVDDDGDMWGECVPDAEGAHGRAQSIVSFLGYQELTCNTDPVSASTVCDAQSDDGAVHELAIEYTGDLTHDIVTRPAPSTTTEVAPRLTPTAASRPPANDCDPNYTGCVPIDSDVDCAGGSGNGPSYVRGPVRVIGSDIYDLDRDGDGVGCE